MGISLIGNSPCKIASEILCLSESSSSQQAAKAAGPSASPGAAAAAYCQPELLVKMVKPPRCHHTAFPRGTSIAFRQRFPAALRVAKLPPTDTAPKRCGVLSKPGRRHGFSACRGCSERRSSAWVWLSYFLDRTMCQGVLCPGEATTVVEGAVQSDVQVGVMSCFALLHLECRENEPSGMNLPTGGALQEQRR